MSLDPPISHQDEFQYVSCSNKINHAFIIDDLEYESSDERAIGEEIQYGFTTKVECPICQHMNEVTGEVWGYPEGIINVIQLT